jgi:16S rRNA (cytidine1402-2'-O)-methyltransferase
MSQATVYLIPTVLVDDDADALAALPTYLKSIIEKCTVFFVENERTTRRFFKKLWPQMVIDNYQWHTIHKAEPAVQQQFIAAIKTNQTIGIVSEAGCPAIADPGAHLVHVAHQHGAKVKPLIGPSSILLALMASGLNGQQFTFNGYLPIEQNKRAEALKQLEQKAINQSSAELFIETPYRNNQLLDTILKTCANATLLCIAVNLTGANELVQTQTIGQWKSQKIDLHKKPVIFILGTGI